MKLTITELVRRLNQLPQDIHQAAQADVEETDRVVTITIPTSVFRNDPQDVRSLLLPEGGIHGSTG